MRHKRRRRRNPLGKTTKRVLIGGGILVGGLVLYKKLMGRSVFSPGSTAAIFSTGPLAHTAGGQDAVANASEQAKQLLQAASAFRSKGDTARAAALEMQAHALAGLGMSSGCY